MKRWISRCHVPPLPGETTIELEQTARAMNCWRLKTKFSPSPFPRLASWIWCLLAVMIFFAGRASVQPVPSDAGESITRNRELSARADARPGADLVRLNRGRGVVARAESSAATVGNFLAESDPLVANKILAELLLDLNPSRARTLFESLLAKSKDSKQPDARLSLLLIAWGRLDGPAAAAAVAELVPDPALRGAALESIMSGWVSRDPEGAKAHLAEVSDPRERSVLRKGIVRGLATADPSAAMEFATRSMGADASVAGRLWGGFALDEGVREIASVQVEHGTLQAAEWAEGLPDGPAKAIAFKQVTEALLRDDPLEAARWIEAHAEGDHATETVRRVARELARRDPMEAIQWANGLPDQARNKALQEAVLQWTRSDLVTAGEYLADLPASSTRDVAVGSFASELSSEAPEIAAEWAAWIQDDTLRLDALETVARTWLQSEPDLAKQWLSASSLPVENQEQVIAEAGMLSYVPESESDANH